MLLEFKGFIILKVFSSDDQSVFLFAISYASLQMKITVFSFNHPFFLQCGKNHPLCSVICCPLDKKECLDVYSSSTSSTAQSGTLSYTWIEMNKGQYADIEWIVVGMILRGLEPKAHYVLGVLYQDGFYFQT